LPSAKSHLNSGLSLSSFGCLKKASPILNWRVISSSVKPVPVTLKNPSLCTYDLAWCQSIVLTKIEAGPYRLLQLARQPLLPAWLIESREVNDREISPGKVVGRLAWTLPFRDRYRIGDGRRHRSEGLVGWSEKEASRQRQLFLGLRTRPQTSTPQTPSEMVSWQRHHN
jgi:hypothetical protein